MTPLARRALIIVSTLAAALVIGTCGFVWIAGYPWLDAFYMAVFTMTTVGYGELHPLSEVARLFNSIYIILSVSLLFLAIGLMTQTIVEAQFKDVIGKRRTRKMIDKLKNHYIICGYGRVGRGAAAQLRQAGASFVIIDRREDRVEWAIKAGYLACLGDSTRDETLREARIDHAIGLIAALGSDADNLFAVISAKTLNPHIRVAARAAEEEAERKMRQVGADSVFAPYTMTGTRLAQALLSPHVRQFLDFTTLDFNFDARIEQVEVSPRSVLAGKSLADSNIRGDMKVIVLAICRADGHMEFNPAASAVIEPRDYLIVMGESEPLRQFEARLAGELS